MNTSLIVSLTLLAVLSATVSACNREFVLHGIEAKVEKTVTRPEKKALLQDAALMLDTRISVPPHSYFGKVFGGGNTADVLRYLDERVNYIVSKDTMFDERLVSYPSHLAESLAAKGEPETIAMNIGTVAWFIREASLPQEVTFRFGKREIPLTSSRVGIIQLGNGYTSRKTNRLLSPAIFRQATLVHEARHSDCTGGLHRADLERMKNGEIPGGLPCGHLHALCPSGHPYAGNYACDKNAWDAYTVEMIFAISLAEKCLNCTEQQKTTAKAVALDAASRILPLEEMVAGKLGEPDMSSSGLVD